MRVNKKTIEINTLIKVTITLEKGSIHAFLIWQIRIIWGNDNLYKWELFWDEESIEFGLILDFDFNLSDKQSESALNIFSFFFFFFFLYLFFKYRGQVSILNRHATWKLWIKFNKEAYNGTYTYCCILWGIIQNKSFIIFLYHFDKAHKASGSFIYIIVSIETVSTLVVYVLDDYLWHGPLVVAQTWLLHVWQAYNVPGPCFGYGFQFWVFIRACALWEVGEHIWKLYFCCLWYSELKLLELRYDTICWMEKV